MSTLASRIVIALACGLVAAAATGPSPASRPMSTASTRPAVGRESSPTPNEALLHWYEALAARDDEAVARRSIIESPSGYCDAYLQMTFASARLDELTWKKKLKRGPAVNRSRNPDRYPNAGFVKRPPDRDQIDRMRPAIEKMEWKTTGDIATPADPQLAGDKYGHFAARKLKDGWILVLSDPTFPPTKPAAQCTRELKAVSAAIEESMNRINAGTFQSIREINDYLEAEFAKVKPLAPTKKPDATHP